ncbi:hypothetical protein M0813_26556 [Anaeramoeba flamelloides]|uniref:Uncharacterized protein n=1 Tax=Anaeramoeba flamelloides TaxID=1746091 RepID=A0ABQ8XYU4_9EUKA|nr:hypothetical protein M0813_26556 [Anaeramoeba flamelloides]
MSFDNKLDVSMIDLLDICIESNIPLTALDKILKVCYSLLLRNPPRTTLYRSEKGLSNYVKNNFDFVKTRIANFIDDEKNLVEHPYIPLNESLRQFLSIDYLRKNLILKPDHGSDPNNKNFSPQQFTSLKNFENKVLNNLEEDEIPICISFFYDHHEVNKKQNVGGFYFFIENLPVWWARRNESIFLISNILEEFNFYSYQHLLNLQKELLSLKQGFIFEKQKYKVFFLKFYSDSKEINQAVGRKDPNAHNQCPYCDQVSIPKKNLQNNEYYSSKIKRHKRNVEEFKENWKKLKNSKNPKEARKIAKKFKDNAILKQKSNIWIEVLNFDPTSYEYFVLDPLHLYLIGIGNFSINNEKSKNSSQINTFKINQNVFYFKKNTFIHDNHNEIIRSINDLQKRVHLYKPFFENSSQQYKYWVLNNNYHSHQPLNLKFKYKRYPNLKPIIDPNLPILNAQNKKKINLKFSKENEKKRKLQVIENNIKSEKYYNHSIQQINKKFKTNNTALNNTIIINDDKNLINQNKSLKLNQFNFSKKELKEKLNKILNQNFINSLKKDLNEYNIFKFQINHKDNKIGQYIFHLKNPYHLPTSVPKLSLLCQDGGFLHPKEMNGIVSAVNDQQH